MNEQEKKDLMEKYAQKLEKTIKTEKTVLKEIEDDRLTLAVLKEKKQSGAPFDNTVYTSWDEWIAQLEKEVKAGETSISNIEFKKVLLEAVKKYVA
ncbi:MULTISPECIES: hypothetical protein [Fusobacterium]|mgnify:FL=1|jgi:hypothetical protein|uniref:hypothetical protein n=1 Tax=Fusobacterium TaxID=848 RepID=UPI0028DB6434|nr:hypothetical protein [uncultured Fusobacterium sp.]